MQHVVKTLLFLLGGGLVFIGVALAITAINQFVLLLKGVGLI